MSRNAPVASIDTAPDALPAAAKAAGQAANNTATAAASPAGGAAAVVKLAKKPAGISPRERWLVFSRIVAGFGLGYVFTWWFTAAAAVWGPAAWGAGRALSVLVATQWSFMVYTVVVIWAFSVRRVRTVWWVLAAGSMVCAALWWALRGHA